MSNDEIKILLIEDDPTLIEMYNLKFQESGYKVSNSTSGVDGLELAKKVKPDIILLDVILPGMDGFAILKTLKSDSVTKNIPVLLLSNLGQESDVKKGKDLGAYDYLVKANFTPSEVVEKVKSALQKK